MHTVSEPVPSSPPREWIEILRSGERVLIRPIHAGDAGMERAFIEGLSPQSRRFRFLDTLNTPSDALLRQLTVIDPSREVAFVAVVDDDRRDREVGVARLSAAARDPDTGAATADCEFALAVSDAWQNKGLGTHLMRHLVDAARAMGLRRMQSSDASDNDRMRRFAAHLAMEHRRDPQDATQVVYTLAVPPAAAPG